VAHSSYTTTMRALLERHGGAVEKFIGDAVVAVFGVPTVHEDDALRAVHTVVEMREALAGLNEELEREPVRLRPSAASQPAWRSARRSAPGAHFRRT
jgi:class 3 adenylate cyclase